MHVLTTGDGSGGSSETGVLSSDTARLRMCLVGILDAALDPAGTLTVLNLTTSGVSMQSDGDADVCKGVQALQTSKCKPCLSSSHQYCRHATNAPQESLHLAGSAWCHSRHEGLLRPPLHSSRHRCTAR